MARRREGRYLLRANITDTDTVKMWEYYLQLTEIEQAFKELKGDLSIRPIHHQLEERIKGTSSSRFYFIACKSRSKPGSKAAPVA